MTKAEKFNLIFVSVPMVIIWILSSFLLNTLFFHEEAVIEPAHTEDCVVMTKYGSCYHHYSCGQIQDNYYWEVGKDTAIESYGLRACTYCGGQSSGTIEYDERVISPEDNEYVISFILMSIPCFLIGYWWYNKFCEESDKKNEQTIPVENTKNINGNDVVEHIKICKECGCQLSDEDAECPNCHTKRN